MKKVKKMQWRRLDNAAKIFPPTSSRRDTKVFRISCELYEPVEADYLQSALEKTVERFPFFTAKLKHGLFWYYFEDRTALPPVKEEYKSPCDRLYYGENNCWLFEVTYYNHRINLEVYHALTDGTGALYFLKTLVLYYLKDKHHDVLSKKHIDIDYDASEYQKADDSFSKYYNKPQKQFRTKNVKAYRLSGETHPDYRLSVIAGCLSAREALNKARAMGTTISILLCAVLIESIHQVMSLQEQKSPIVLTVPVNLRNYFSSVSARNFFGVINVGYDYSRQPGTRDDIIGTLSKGFEQQLTEEHLFEHINRLSAIEHKFAAKIVPLPLKNPVMNLANRVVDQTITAAFSNIGRIQMPEEVSGYIRSFDLLSSTKRLQCCACSYLDNLVITFTTPFVNTDVQRYFFRSLAELGLHVEITSNLSGETAADTAGQSGRRPGKRSEVRRKKGVDKR